MIDALQFLIAGLAGGFLRRLFGGGWKEVPLLSGRGVQTVLMVAGMGLCLGLDMSNIALGIPILFWLQFQFWSRGHGCCFDLGRGGEPDSKTVERYKERWYHYPLDWFYARVGAKPYDFCYDFLYMFLRYSCPMLLVAIVLKDPMWLLVGLPIANIYAFCWSLFELSPWVANVLPSPFNRSTALAEFFSGFWVFGWLTLCSIPS